jgi:hypothetical protein
LQENSRSWKRPQPTPGRLAALLIAALSPLAAQDDITTQSGPSALNGAWITGPASNPLSFLNGPAYRSFGSRAPYDFPDLRPATRLDESLPHWITFGLEERFRFESYHHAGFKPDNNDSYLLNRFRLQMNIQLSRGFKLVSQVQDSRPFFQKPPVGPPNENRWDLKLAYAELGDPEKHWISLRIGRQLINYNNTLIANSEWRNQARSYDAAVANLRSGRYRLGIFAASVVTPLDSGISHHQEGNNLYGLYGGIDRILPSSTLEPFVLWRVQPTIAIEAAGVRTGRQNEKAYGFRLKGQPARNLDYSWQMVLERGSDGPNGIRAWGATGGAAYRFDSLPWHLRPFTQFDFASGDKSPADGIHGTFDTMYPTAHDRLGILDLFGWQNLRAARGGLTVEPRHRWTFTAQYHDFWLASGTDALYNSSGGVIVRDLNARSGNHVGEEVDVFTWYELNRHVNVGAGFGHLMPGAFLSSNTRGPSYSSPYFAINFKDSGRSNSH